MCHEYFEVKRSAVEWIKQNYPALSIKAGLCESVGGRLYIIVKDGQEKRNKEYELANLRAELAASQAEEARLRGDVEVIQAGVGAPIEPFRSTSEYIQEAERLIDEYEIAVADHIHEGRLISEIEQVSLTRAALLAHIERGVPDGMAIVPEMASAAMLRPFYECPPEELQIAWKAALSIAQSQDRHKKWEPLGPIAYAYPAAPVEPSEVLHPTGCHRSHPHENMNPECERKTVEAHDAFQAAQKGGA